MDLVLISVVCRPLMFFCFGVLLQKLIQPSFEAEYVLSGDRHHFLIKKATVEGNFFFKPYGVEGGQLNTHTT